VQEGLAFVELQKKHGSQPQITTTDLGEIGWRSLFQISLLKGGRAFGDGKE